MTNIKRLTVWTIVISFFIIIGAGHGIACVGLLEIVGLFHKFNIGTEDFSLSLTASYDKSLAAVALFALVGHIFLIISILTKNYRPLFWIKIIGLLFLWTSSYYLTHNSLNDNLSQIGFVTGLPFFIVSIILTFKVAKQKYQSVYG
jgi:hypothetical protein